MIRLTGVPKPSLDVELLWRGVYNRGWRGRKRTTHLFGSGHDPGRFRVFELDPKGNYRHTTSVHITEVRITGCSEIVDPRTMPCGKKKIPEYWEGEET